MKQCILIFCLVALSVMNGQTTFKKSEEAIKSLTNDQKTVGIAGGIYQNGNLLWSCTSGYANAQEKIRFTSQTLSRTASIAKPMTAIAVLQLYEQGLVDLEAPIQTYVKDFPVKQEGVITVRHLLNHSSGLGAYTSKKEAHDASHYNTLTEAMNVFKDRDLLDKPGVAEYYTTYGYVVLGVLIERVTGQTYETYMRENIWIPLEMNDTGVETVGVSYENKSLLYHQKKPGKIKEVPNTNDLSNRIPGGGLYSTVDDLLRFGTAVINYTLISEETTNIMLAEQGVNYDGNPYALGWFLYSQSGERRDIFGHGGAQRGCSSQLMIIPKKKIVIAVLANTSGLWGEVIGASAVMIEEAVAYSNEQVSNNEQ